MMVQSDELLLLHAILEKSDSRAIEYYKKWITITNLDDIEGGSFRLLPLLYKRLSKTGQEIPHIEKLKGVYRQNLYKNSLLFHKFLSILVELEKREIPVIVLKGIALIAAYYEDTGIRPMSDADFLVPEEDVKRTLKYFKEQGWQERNGSWLDKPVKHIHSLDLISPDHYEMDIHWRAFYQCPWDRADEELWKQTEEVSFKGFKIKILNPTQQILHNCAHGLRWNAISSIRWTVDVLTVMKKRSDAIDWAMLVSEAASRNLSLTMSYALSFLKNEFDAPVPGEVLNQLDRLPKDSQEIRFFRVLTSPPNLRNRIYKKWLMHSNSMGDASFLIKAAAFPDFISKAFYQVPFYIRKRIRQRKIQRHPS
ncbi:MAG: nucleotidyltransferase family protein [Desulfocapsa sp.]|nr:nucleotidyltransferase family protein [Desulfocapsa sp.]